MAQRITLAGAFRLEVDPAAWDVMYGNGASPEEVRADVQAYLTNHIQESYGLHTTGGRVLYLALVVEPMA